MPIRMAAALLGNGAILLWKLLRSEGVVNSSRFMPSTIQSSAFLFSGLLITDFVNVSSSTPPPNDLSTVIQPSVILKNVNPYWLILFLSKAGSVANLPVESFVSFSAALFRSSQVQSAVGYSTLASSNISLL
ncbi:hypothetical protein D1872_276740 [compost metagenome]